MAFERLPFKERRIENDHETGFDRNAETPSCRGQALVEFTLLLPLLLLILLAVVEFSFLLHDQHVLTRMTREGSNLISRGATRTPITDAATAMISVANFPVDLESSNSEMIFTVLRLYNGPGDNHGKIIIYKRHAIGGLGEQSVLGNPPSGLFSGQDYSAENLNNPALQATNVPEILLGLGPDNLVFVTEIYTRYDLIGPLDRFGFSLPTTLHDIAYF
jgi:hypothetical protein